MKYISLTTKHHDGFCLWPSAYTEYDIESTPFKRDIVRELSEACKKNELVFATYYSIIDWYHPDYQPYNHGGPGALYKSLERQADFDLYIEYMKNQLKELVQNYGSEIIQLDGEWEENWNHKRGSDLYRCLKEMNDELLINNRVDVGRQHIDSVTNKWNWQIYAGDFEERERMVDWVGEESQIHGKSEVPWQAWVTIDQAQWAYNENPRLLTADEVITDMIKTIGDNGNYLINLGPRPDGSFHPEQIKIIEEFGKWIKKYHTAIYNTRGGPFAHEDKYTSTTRDDTVYVFVLDQALNMLKLNTEGQNYKVRSFNGENIASLSTNSHLSFNIPPDRENRIRVFVLTPEK